MRRGIAWLLVIAVGGCASAPILELGPGTVSLDDPPQQLALQEAMAESRPVPGNRVGLLRDGGQTLSVMFGAMAAAQDHINLEFFTFENVADRNGQALGDLLVDRLAHGVQVDVIYDSLGSQDADATFLDRLRGAGAHLLSFNPALTTEAGALVNPNDRDHRKMLVVDGRTGFIGGVNLDPVYQNRAAGVVDDDASDAVWRDVDARIDGPAVAELQRLFLHTWADQSGTALTGRNWFPPVPAMGDQTVRIIGSAPGEDRPLYYVSVMTAIHTARHSISASTGYFVPTHQERQELARAARRGVRVRLILPGKSDSPTALAAGHAAYDDLLEAGVEIVELQQDVLHAKVAVVDGAWTAIGSSNLDRRSVAFNNEVDAIILGAETGAAMEALLERNRARGTRIELASWRARPLGDRGREWFARFWEFML